MGMHSEREEFYEREAKNKNLADIGRYIRSLPENEQKITMNSFKKIGINVGEAMHQSATHHWDPYW